MYYFKDLDNNKIYIAHLENDHSKKILYQYLDSHFPHIKKFAFYCPLFSSEKNKIMLKKCWHCDKKNVLLRGVNLLNPTEPKGEYAHGICKKCNNECEFHYYYDNYDNYKTIQDDNIVAFGNYFRNYNTFYYRREKKTQKSNYKNKLNSIMKNKKIYIIDEPCIDNIKKNILIKYITIRLKQQNIKSLKIVENLGDVLHKKALEIDRETRIYKPKNLLLEKLYFDIVDDICEYIE